MSVEEILLIVTFILQWVLLFIGSNTTKSAVEMLESQGLKIQTQKELIDNQEELIETLQDRLHVYEEAMLKAMQDEPQTDCSWGAPDGEI